MRVYRFFTIAVLLSLLTTSLFSQNIGDSLSTGRELIMKGVKLHDEQKYEEATALYLQVLPSDSLYQLALYELAFSYAKAKKYKEGIAVANKALSYDSQNRHELYLCLGSLYNDRGDMDSAITIYQKGLTLYPFSYKLHNEIGISHMKGKNYKAAYESFTKSLKLNPFHPKTHLNIGFLAANSNHPTLALMALQTVCLVQSDANSILQTVTSMEEIASNTYSPKSEDKIDENIIPNGNAFEEIDGLIHSKVALTNKYKTRIKLNYQIIKQMQLLCEHLPSSLPKNDYINQFYLDFYNNVWNKNMYEGMALCGLEKLDAPDIKKAATKYASDIYKFKNWGSTYLSEYTDKETIKVNGKTENATKLFDNGLVAIGNIKNNLKTGGWIIFYSNGEKSAEGFFIDNEKDGKWTYYTNNGKLKSTEFYENGKIDKEYLSYYDNNQLSERVPYKSGEINGKVELFLRNGSYKQTVNFEAGKSNGKRTYYDRYNCKFSEYTEVAGVLNGEYKEFYPSGKVETIGTYISDKLEGSLKGSFENGNKMFEGQFVAGERDQTWTWYYDNGKVKEKGSYKKGKKDGMWQTFYETGVLSASEIFKNDLSNGPADFFDTDGKKFATYEYKNDKLQNYVYYDKAGAPLIQEKIKSGKLKIIKYNPEGYKIAEGQILNKKESGDWKFYYLNGNVDWQVSYKEGQKEGFQKEFYKNGTLKAEKYFTNGLLEGYSKTYHANGQIASSGYNKKGEKDGLWNYYNVDGKLISSELINNGLSNGSLTEYTFDGKKEFETIYTYGDLEELIAYNPSNNSSTNLKFIKGASSSSLVYTNGKVRREGSTKYGKLDGLVKWYNSNGNITSTFNYKYGKKHGASKSFSSDGIKIAEGKYSYDQKDSIWNYYDLLGRLSYVANYKNGNLEGQYTTYYAEGKIETQRTYVNDQQHGAVTFYNPDGTVRIQLNYYYGDLISYTYPNASGVLTEPIKIANETVDIQVNHPNGKLAEKLTYKYGLREGNRIIYNKDGKPILEANYLHHDYHGLFKEYYINGKISCELNYKYDELDGLSKYYYENGNIKSVETYVLGDLHGPATYYDQTGKIIRKVTYQYGQIQ